MLHFFKVKYYGDTRYLPEIIPESVRRGKFPILNFFLMHKSHSKLNIIYFENISHTYYVSWYIIYEGLLLCFRRLWIGKRFQIQNCYSKFSGQEKKFRSPRILPLLFLTSMHSKQNRNSLRNSYQLERGKRNSWNLLQLMTLLTIFNDKIMLHTWLEYSKAYKPWQKL